MSTTAEETVADVETGNTPWGAVASLGIGSFILVTGEFLPASLLSQIAAGIHVSEGVAGQLVTATAITGAVAALAISPLLPRLDRRVVMIGLTVLSIVSNLAISLAPSFGLMLVARLVLGVAIGGFWAMALAVVAQLVRPRVLGRAMTVVNAGVSLATVAAVPLGAWLGEQWGWRAVFAAVAAAGVLAVAIQVILLPSVRPAGAPGLAALRDTLRSSLVVVGLVAIALVVSGHFGAFTYIRPAAAAAGVTGAEALSVLLLVYGVAAFVGNLLSGPVSDRSMRAAVILFPVLIGAGTVVFATTGGAFVATVIAAAVWGLGFGGVPTAVQTWMARVAPDHLEAAGGLVVATFQVAIALGAALGGLIVDAANVQVTLVAGGATAVVGGVLLGLARRRAA
jgi:predicted MFS family arabinose efflux permease